MYKRNKKRWLKHWDFILIDFVLLQAAFVISYMLRNGIYNPYNSILYRNTGIVIGLIDLCLGLFMESYSKILRRGYFVEFKAVTKHVIVITLGMISYLFLSKTSGDYSRMSMIIFPIAAIVLLYIGRVLLKLWIRKRKVPEHGKRSIILVGALGNYQKLVDNFIDNEYSGFRVVAVFVIGKNINIKQIYRSIPVIDNEDALYNCIMQSHVDEVLFSIPLGMDIPEDVIDNCKLMGLTTHLKLARLEKEHANQFVETIEGYTVLSTYLSPATPGQMFWKRLMDIIGSVVGLIFTAILFVIIAPIIYIKSPGRVIFSQIRVGKNGRKFKIYKFRSMYLDAEERKRELMEQEQIRDVRMFKMENDPRIISGIGHFIRKHSLDEFPQFWNVLKGDMSLVGTRPPTVDEWEKYEFHHRKRLAIKPGITGLWQVSGRSDIVDFEEVVKLDIKYISEWNLGLDIKIIIKTVLELFKKNGAM